MGSVRVRGVATLVCLLVGVATSLVMHHVTSCSQCGKHPQGQKGSWCDDPNCVAFEFDADHIEGPPLTAIGCAVLGHDPITYCLGVHGPAIYAATNHSVPCVDGPCPPPPSPPPSPLKYAFHIAAHGGANDVNAVFEYKGIAHLFRQGDSGWQHYSSTDFVSWNELPTILEPGGWDGSLSLLPLSNGSVEVVILYDCVTVGDCRPASGADANITTLGRSASRPVGLGDPPIIGVARPADPSDPQLKVWMKDAHNPIAIAESPPTYSGPSNLWRRADGSVDFVMILGDVTGLFRSTDPALHNWTLVNPKFYPTRGGGGGLFFPLPAPGGGPSGYTHMLQSNFHEDGSAFFVLGTYDSQGNDTFGNVRPTPASIDYSSAFRYFELGYRADGTIVSSGWVMGMGTSITRQIGWDPELETLVSVPVPEVASLHEKTLTNITSITPLHPEVPLVLVASGVTFADIEFAMRIPTGTSNATVDVCGAITLSLMVLGPSPTGRRTVTLGGRVPSMIGTPTFELKSKESIVSVRILVDAHVAEIFVGGGRAVVTSPGLSLAAQCALSVTATTAGMSIENASAWTMRSVF